MAELARLANARAQDKAAADAYYAQQAQAQVQAPPAPAPPPVPAGGETDMIAELKQLGEMHVAGVLSDDEFAAAKAKLLG